jgi:hypothetical protein
MGFAGITGCAGCAGPGTAGTGIGVGAGAGVGEGVCVVDCGVAAVVSEDSSAASSLAPPQAIRRKGMNTNDIAFFNILLFRAGLVNCSKQLSGSDQH